MDKALGRLDVGVCVDLLDIGQTDEQTLWHLFCSGQLLLHVSYILRMVAQSLFWGHVFCQVIHTAHPPGGI